MTFKLWIPAIGAESAAVLLLARGETALPIFMACLLLHAVASALAVSAAVAFYPRTYRRPLYGLWLTLFGLNFFVPVVGLAMSMLGAWAALLPTRFFKARPFQQIAAPDYTATQDYDLTRLRSIAVHARLRESALPPKARAESLLASSSASNPSSNALLRDMLNDPSDEIRLLAYGLYDRREKSIAEQLAREHGALAAAEKSGDLVVARHLHHRIALLYWELVYQVLVQGDMQRYALEQALSHAVRALDGSMADGALWLLIARIRLNRGELDLANAALEAARQNGVPSHGMLPYLAELRFKQRRYAEVRAMMRALGVQPATERLYAIQQFWAAPGSMRS